MVIQPNFQLLNIINTVNFIYRCCKPRKYICYIQNHSFLSPQVLCLYFMCLLFLMPQNSPFLFHIFFPSILFNLHFLFLPISRIKLYLFIKLLIMIIKFYNFRLLQMIYLLIHKFCFLYKNFGNEIYSSFLVFLIIIRTF
jgi:hypothetical protein